MLKITHHGSGRNGRLQLLLLKSLLSVMLLAPAIAGASHLDVARLATQLNLASGQLAYGLRGSGAHSSIRQRSEYLSREAADLVDAVRRNRSSLHLQSQYQDVSQRFVSLEQAFLRLHQRDFNPFLANEFNRISGIYSNLSAEFQYIAGYGNSSTNGYGRSHNPVYKPPIVIYKQVPSPGYGISRGFQQPWPQGGLRGQQYGQQHEQQHEQRHEQQHIRHDYGRRQVQRFPTQDHRSAVLDRQQRLDSRHPVFEQGRRGARAETGRRNHYD